MGKNRNISCFVEFGKLLIVNLINKRVIINDIRRMEEGKMQLHKEPADLSALTEEALDQFKPRADLKGVAMSFSSSDGSASLNMDREIIKRVVDNLLNNAIRHTPEGGEITIFVDIPSGQVGGRFRVIDNGDGG